MKAINFTPENFAKIVRGEKTQTRRIAGDKPRYAVGDVLAVRTSWRVSDEHDDVAPSELPGNVFIYLDGLGSDGKLRPAMFLPKRFWNRCPRVKVTEVREEPLQVICMYDIVREGVFLAETPHELSVAITRMGVDVRTDVPEIYRVLWEYRWNKINHKPGRRWEDNPDVRVYTFKLLEDAK